METRDPDVEDVLKRFWVTHRVCKLGSTPSNCVDDFDQAILSVGHGEERLSPCLR